MKRDLLHQELKVGDYVAYNDGYIYLGKIIKITPIMIQVSKVKNPMTTVRRYPHDLIKINEQYEHAKSMNPEEFI